MNIILIGSPGSGKGTQSEIISKKYKLRNISVGLLLKKVNFLEKNTLLRIKKNLDKGILIDNKIVFDVLKKELKKNSSKSILLEGYPRTLEQAKMLKNIKIKFNCVIELKAKDETIKNRILGRRVHTKSGRVYHIDFNPPKIKDKDDYTGEDLVVRKDDNIKTINYRIKRYLQESKKIKNFFSENNISYFIVDASEKIEVVSKKIEKIIDFYKNFI
ncbi:nucleoside monophosphate kinase [bacterium endosymbiont of Pedicinus badii]|uniref:nucleoside monophosphate kinase n=1 Tax=bacterium endosymbiont of Pedicinus badii TaxID=1719126 RepID=UPI0009B9315C|nr:nucleoside monophosphate kinase [bacterium endosymbiont of Pedicinus badii]OQM34299.1 hypothetical protein AOQ89_00145 [bacterium endosymbiont of Pedicinus badii]